MRVLLIAHTGVCGIIPGYVEHQGTPEEGWPMEADELAEQAGRMLYDNWDRTDPKTADNRSYLTNMFQKGVTSVLDHASATFYIDGATYRLARELRGYGLGISEARPPRVDVKLLATGSHGAWRAVLWDALSPAANTEFREAGMLLLPELKTLAPSIYQDFTDDGWVTA